MDKRETLEDLQGNLGNAKAALHMVTINSPVNSTMLEYLSLLLTEIKNAQDKVNQLLNND